MLSDAEVSHGARVRANDAAWQQNKHEGLGVLSHDERR